MISVYIDQYNPIPNTQWSDGNTETLLFTIPNTSGTELPLSATVKTEMGNAGNFEFSLKPTSIWYDICKHMRTIFRVEYDGVTVFIGRVLTIDRDMFRTKRIHCEGAFTFFMDSVFEGTKEGTTETLNAYIHSLLDAHNECMGTDLKKKIYVGFIPGEYPEALPDEMKINNDTQKYAASKGYKTVKEWLEELVSDYGGFMRIRYANGNMLLDWFKMYFNPIVSDQTISINSNTIDLSDTVEVNNIFTYVIPVGKNDTYISGGSGGGGGGGSSGKYTITVTSNNEEYGTATASQLTANGGETITLTAAPASGYHLSYYQYNFKGSITTLATDKFTMPDGNVSIKAVFDEGGGAQLDYSITVNNSGGGTAQATDKDGNPISIQRQGELVKIAATPASGWVFDHLRISTGGAPYDVNARQFDMPACDTVVTAVFSQGGYSIEVRNSGAVSASATDVNGTPITVQEAGKPVKIFMNIASGWAFDHLRLVYDGTSSDIYSRQFTMPESSVIVTAVAKQIPKT